MVVRIPVLSQYVEMVSVNEMKHVMTGTLIIMMDVLIRVLLLPVGMVSVNEMSNVMTVIQIIMMPVQINVLIMRLMLDVMYRFLTPMALLRYRHLSCVLDNLKAELSSLLPKIMLSLVLLKQGVLRILFLSQDTILSIVSQMR